MAENNRKTKERPKQPKGFLRRFIQSSGRFKLALLSKPVSKDLTMDLIDEVSGAVMTDKEGAPLKGQEWS